MLKVLKFAKKLWYVMILILALLVVQAFCESTLPDYTSDIVDVGIHKLERGSIVGDVDFHSVEDKVSYITPVPGGVGQMTVAILCQNIFKAYFERN